MAVPKVSSGDCKATPRGCSEDFEASPRGVLGSSKEVESSSKVVENWVRSGCKVSQAHFLGIFSSSKKLSLRFSWDFLQYLKTDFLIIFFLVKKGGGPDFPMSTVFRFFDFLTP